MIDQAYQDRPGNKDIQLSILYNAKRNLDVYADWRDYFRKQQPPMLITWGTNEPPRVYRRRVDLSYATKAGRSSEA